MTLIYAKHGLAAAFLAGFGGTFVAHAEVVQSDAAGEVPAHRYYAQNLNQFLSLAPVMTPELSAGAVAQGRFEGSRVPRWAIRQGPAGEPQARIFYVEHRSEFARQIAEITPEQREAARVEGWQQRATASQVFRDGGGWTVPAEFIPLKDRSLMERGRSAPAWHGPAGEPQARIYYFNHSDEFAPQATVITPEQRAAARVEGWHERAAQRHIFRDGGGWRLPAEFIPPKERAGMDQQQAAAVDERPTAKLVFSDGGKWTVPAEFMPPKEGARGNALVWHGPAGEPQARIYYFNHRDEFAREATVITPEQRAAARVEGWHERAAQRHIFRDGGGWRLPAEFILPKERAGMDQQQAAKAVVVEERPTAKLVYSDGGKWTVPAEFIPPKEGARRNALVWHGPAGEAQARVYFFNHRGEFLAEAIEITPEQEAAARVEGWHERATARHIFRDGGGWQLPVEYIRPR